MGQDRLHCFVGWFLELGRTKLDIIGTVAGLDVAINLDVGGTKLDISGTVAGLDVAIDLEVGRTKLGIIEMSASLDFVMSGVRRDEVHQHQARDR